MRPALLCARPRGGALPPIGHQGQKFFCVSDYFIKPPFCHSLPGLPDCPCRPFCPVALWPGSAGAALSVPWGGRGPSARCRGGRFAVRCGPFGGVMRAVSQPQTPLAVQRPVRQRACPVTAAALRERSTAPMMVATAPSMPMRSVFTIRS